MIVAMNHNYNRSDDDKDDDDDDHYGDNDNDDNDDDDDQDDQDDALHCKFVCVMLRFQNQNAILLNCSELVSLPMVVFRFVKQGRP